MDTTFASGAPPIASSMRPICIPRNVAGGILTGLPAKIPNVPVPCVPCVCPGLS